METNLKPPYKSRTQAINLHQRVSVPANSLTKAFREKFLADSQIVDKDSGNQAHEDE